LRPQRGDLRVVEGDLLVDQNIKGALGIADYVYVMRTGILFAKGPRSDFTDDVETLVSRWLYTT